MELIDKDAAELLSSILKLKFQNTLSVNYKLKLKAKSLPSANQTTEISRVELIRKIKLSYKITARVNWCFTIFSTDIGLGTASTSSPFVRYSNPAFLPFESLAGSTPTFSNFSFDIWGLSVPGNSTVSSSLLPYLEPRNYNNILKAIP